MGDDEKASVSEELRSTKAEMADLLLFLRQFENALMDELKKSASKYESDKDEKTNTNSQLSIPTIPENSTNQERIQLCISSYFNFQESRNKELDLCTQRLKQLESAIMNEENRDEIQNVLNETRDNFNTHASEPMKMYKNVKGNRNSPSPTEGVTKETSRIPVKSVVTSDKSVRSKREKIQSEELPLRREKRRSRGSQGSLSGLSEPDELPKTEPKQQPVELVKVWSTDKDENDNDWNNDELDVDQLQ